MRTGRSEVRYIWCDQKSESLAWAENLSATLGKAKTNTPLALKGEFHISITLANPNGLKMCQGISVSWFLSLSPYGNTEKKSPKFCPLQKSFHDSKCIDVYLAVKYAFIAEKIAFQNFAPLDSNL